MWIIFACMCKLKINIYPITTWWNIHISALNISWTFPPIFKTMAQTILLFVFHALATQICVSFGEKWASEANVSARNMQKSRFSHRVTHQLKITRNKVSGRKKRNLTWDGFFFHIPGKRRWEKFIFYKKRTSCLPQPP